MSSTDVEDWLHQQEQQAAVEADLFHLHSRPTLLPGWLDQDREAAQRYYRQKLLAFLQHAALLPSVPDSAATACAWLAQQFNLTVTSTQVSIPVQATPHQTQRAVESGLLLFLYTTPTPTIQVTGGNLMQSLYLLQALLYLPCGLDSTSWQRMQTRFAPEEKNPSPETRAWLCQWDALYYLTRAKEQLRQRPAYQQLNPHEQVLYLAKYLPAQAESLLHQQLTQQKVPPLVAGVARGHLRDTNNVCRRILGKANLTVAQTSPETDEKKSTPAPRGQKSTVLSSVNHQHTAWVVEDVSEESDEEEDDEEDPEQEPITTSAQFS